MFDFSMSEIALLVVVALVFIGPKDLPVALRGLSKAIKAMRRMAGEFQQHLDDMVKEADLSEARDELNKLRRFSVKDRISKALDPDGTLAQQVQDPTLPSMATSHQLPNQQNSPDQDSSSHGASSSEPLGAHFSSKEPEGEEKMMPHNVLMAQRAEALEHAPALLPPTSALRLIEDSARCHRPACLPPEIALHYGKRVLIVKEEEVAGYD